MSIGIVNSEVANGRSSRWVGLDEWWTDIVIKDLHNESFSRRDLVLALAHKEGGAHVDTLDARVDALLNGHSAGWLTSVDDNAPTTVSQSLVHASVRTLAEELSISINRLVLG